MSFSKIPYDFQKYVKISQDFKGFHKIARNFSRFEKNSKYFKLFYRITRIWRNVKLYEIVRDFNIYMRFREEMEAHELHSNSIFPNVHLAEKNID